MEQEHTHEELEQNFQENFTTTTDIYQNGWIAPQWFLTMLNAIAATAIVINLIHIILMARMKVGIWVAANNFKAFVIYLAFTDLFLSGGRLCLDNYFVQTYMHENHWLCVTSTTLIHSLNVFQTCLLALASLERFIAVCAGANYSSNTFVKHYPKFLGLILALWLVVYVVIAIIFRNLGYSTQGASACQLANTAVPWLDLISGLSGLLSLIALITFYSLLLCKSMMMTRKVNKSNSTRNAISKRSSRLNRTVSALVITKIILWVPIIVLVVTRTVGIQILQLGFIGSISLYLCSITNPLLYGCTSSKYRKYIQDTLRCDREASVSTTSNGSTVYSKKELPPQQQETSHSTTSGTVSTQSSTACSGSNYSENNLI